MFTELTELSDIRLQMNAEGFNLFYFSRPACGVCTVLKKKVSDMLTAYPRISSFYINLDKVPEAAGQFSLFTIPAVLFYSDGKEIVREARYIAMDDLESKIARPYRLAGQ